MFLGLLGTAFRGRQATMIRAVYNRQIKDFNLKRRYLGFSQLPGFRKTRMLKDTGLLSNIGFIKDEGMTGGKTWGDGAFIVRRAS